MKTTEFAELLRQSQNSDGGFAYFPGRKSCLEPTSLAVLALGKIQARGDAERINKARQYLLGCRQPSGGWTITKEDSSPAWETPLALLALSGNKDLEPVCRSGVDAYLRTMADPANPQGTTLNPKWRGWNWYPPTPGWVEPTSLGLIAARRLAHFADENLLSSRLEDGRQFLLNRMAPDGGWNYGNSYVLGRAVSSFLSPTAMALLALQPTDGRSDQLQRPLQQLEKDLGTATSGLALSWGILALLAYERPVYRIQETLHTAWERSRFMENSAVISLAVLALTSILKDHPFLPERTLNGR